MKRVLSVLALLCVVRDIETASPRLDIDRLYHLPWVIGTAPQDFAWSPDSKAVAFLWNDAGRPFRDVWIARRDDAKPIRVTAMPQPAVPAHPGNDLSKLQQAAEAEIRASRA